MSEAGIEASSWFALTNVVRRALPSKLTTALGAKPPPFTVSVNAGPFVATICGDMEVISIPTPIRFGVDVLTGTEAVTLSCADSLPVADGVNVRVTSQANPAAGAAGRAKGGAGQAELLSPFETNGTR